MRDYISASQVSWFLKCPLAYKHQYIDDIGDKFKGNIYTAFGSAIHAALEYNFKQKITSKKDLPINDVLKKFGTEFEKEVDKLPYSDGAENLFLDGSDMILEYMQQKAPGYQPIAVEKKFKIELKSIGVTILGYIDLILEG